MVEGCYYLLLTEAVTLDSISLKSTVTHDYKMGIPGKWKNMITLHLLQGLQKIRVGSL